MPNHSSLAIANEFIDRANREGAQISQMQLQKLVYLAHGWNLAITESPLIEDPIEAWDYGPVIRKLYDALRKYGKSPILSKICWGDDLYIRLGEGEIACATLSENERNIVDKVWSTYKSYHAYQLSSLTHQDGSPWHQIFKKGMNKVIGDNILKEYFLGLAKK